MKLTNSLVAIIGGAALAAQSSAGTLGAASDFNVFVKTDFSSQYSDTEGNMAVGRDLNIAGYSVALVTGGAGKTVLQVGRKLTLNGGTIHGNSLYGDTFSLSNASTGTLTKGTSIDFDAAFADLKLRSTQWAGLTSTGTAVFQYSTLTLAGSNADLNVFNITAADLNNGSLSQVKFMIPAGARALVNVSGLAGVFKNIGYDGLDAESILWNLPTATSVTNNSFKGSLLAPNANITGGYGAIDGQVIANSFSGPTQINYRYFRGNIPFKTPNAVSPVPEPMTIMLGVGGLVAAVRRRRAR